MRDGAGRTATGGGVAAPQSALAFWEAGLRVFPLHGFLADSRGKGARCLCGWSECKAPGKHPIAGNWQHTPAWDPDQVETMVETGQFDSGFGVLCKGLLVIDVDARNGGLASFAKLSKKVPEIAGAELIVETGSGGGSRHLYFRAPQDGTALLQHLPEYPGLDFKSSGYVVGPGSRHASGGNYSLAYGSPDDIDEAPPALMALLVRPERHRADYDGRAVDVSHEDIEGMLAHISPDCVYDTWIRIGMAIHHATGGTGQALWDRWSSTGEKYDARKMDTHWHSFGRSSNPVTLGTLIHHAEEGGWKVPVEFGGNEALEPEPVVPGLPFSLSGVDLTCPPGYVGRVADWIEAQSRRPRRRLAVAGALTAIGNIAGMRYSDDLDGVTANLFTFCVAGSRTGKEAIQQAVAEIHRAAGCAAATHGAIKSEQEIIKNLTRHQAAFYVIDEIGIFLQKIRNAQARGGAIYLDGVIGMLMSAYSKADGFMLLTGDMKEEVRTHLLRELATIKRRIEETFSDGKEGGSTIGLETRQRDLERALSGLDNGLERPFLSLLGFTTPVTFDDLVDYQSATNGFIGRSLIFQERDTAPRTKNGFRRERMSTEMATTLARIYNAGEYDSTADFGAMGARVEYYGERTRIPTDARAADMLGAALDWFEDEAIAHKTRTGLEALYLGAYEIVSKVSLILAIPEGRRTAEHVRWAFALVRQDIESKARMVTANDRQKDAPKTALMARVAGLIEGDGETIGVICARLRKHKREDIEKCLDEMVSAGLALRTDIPAAKRQRPTTHYKLQG